MNDETRAKLIGLLEAQAQAIGAVRGWCSTQEATLNALRDVIFSDMLEGGDRVLFGSPVTGKIEPSVWGGDWYAATVYAESYAPNGKTAIHTGYDLNRPNFADSGATVYAAADGEIVYSAAVPGWQQYVVVIKHTLEDGKNIWTRYAHIKNTLGLGAIKRGEVIGVIADYTPAGPQGDHLHFDGARIDLGAHPDDWPGNDLARVKRDYIDMLEFTKQRSK